MGGQELWPKFQKPLHLYIEWQTEQQILSGTYF